MSPTAPQKKYGLFSVAVLLLLCGGAALFLAPHGYTIRSVGVVAVMVSAYLVRISHVHTRSTLSAAAGPEGTFNTQKRPGRIAWVVGLALLPTLAASFLYLHNDAIHGGHTALPAYVFAGVILACAAVWGYIVSQIMR
jgi:hypothetical protein